MRRRPAWEFEFSTSYHLLCNQFETQDLRGFGVEEARKVAQLTIKALENAENDAVLEEVRQEVRALTDQFPLYEK